MEGAHPVKTAFLGNRDVDRRTEIGRQIAGIAADAERLEARPRPDDLAAAVDRAQEVEEDRGRRAETRQPGLALTVGVPGPDADRVVGRDTDRPGVPQAEARARLPSQPFRRAEVPPEALFVRPRSGLK